MRIVPCLIVAALLGQGCTPPDKTAFYGERTTVHALALGDGELFAATKGGLVLYKLGTSAKTFGFKGLLDTSGPDDVWIEDGVVRASAGESVARWDGSSLIVGRVGTWREKRPVSLEGTRWSVPERPIWPDIEPVEPPVGSRGTHVSAVAGDAQGVIAAWYEDGLWRHDGTRWERLAGTDNDEFRYVRCLTLHGDDLALATYAGAVWWRHAGSWTKLPLTEGPDGSVYSLAEFSGKVFAGTFENGVTAFDGARWSTAIPPLVSSSHPRQMAVFQDRLYIRQTTGEVDRFDGASWTKNVFPWLLRGPATCLGVGDGKLLVGQFGGWSEFDGARWEHHLKHPELQGFVATALAARPGEVWIGSQERGVFRYDRKLATLRVYDQRHGLHNDWVRHILIDQGGVKVGMFITGAYVLKGGTFTRLTPGLEGEATGLVRHPRSRVLFVGSREGLWRIDAQRAIRVPIAGHESLEVQALLSTEKGLWMGMPNGIVRVPWEQIAR